MDCGSLFKEIAVESRQDLPCCHDDKLLSCHQVELDIKSLGDADLELAPFNTTVQYLGLVEGSHNSYHYENELVDMVLTVHNGDIYGHMQMDNGDSYVVEYCGNGVHVFKQLDVDKLGDDNGEEDEQDEEFAFQRALTPEYRDDITTIVTFTIKVYYTPTFAAVTADIEGFVEQVIQETNQGYINSNIPLKATAICIEEATIDDLPSSSEMLTAFKNMKGNVQALRGSADAAALLVNSFDSCGRGYVNSIGSGYTLSVTAKSCALGYYSFGHELGHNIGLKHNKEVSTNVYYPDGYGYLIPQGSHSTGLRTILAYSAEGHRTRVNYYSNPNIIHPTTGTPTGVADVADNARIITMNRFALAAVGDESQCDSYPIDKECILENVNVREYSRIIGYSIYTKATCASNCTAKPDCFEWMQTGPSTGGTCYHRYLHIKAPGETDSGYQKNVSVINILNPKCTIIRDCNVRRLTVYGSYTLEQSTTPNAKECHVKCSLHTECKYWIWKDNTCDLKADILNSSWPTHWTHGSRVCKF